MMDQVLEAVLLFIRSLLFIVVGSIKALLPNGVLPRKNPRGEVILITGSGSGLGRLMAIEFAKLGAKLVLWDMNEKGNKETKKLVEERGAEAYAYTVDISKNTNIYAAADEVKKDVGNVNILINNAGIVTGKKLFDCPDELMEKTMAVNTNSLFYTAKAFLPAMMEANHGHVVTIASMAGKVGVAGLTKKREDRIKWHLAVIIGSPTIVALVKVLEGHLVFRHFVVAVGSHVAGVFKFALDYV